jgi:hypothetical protein
MGAITNINVNPLKKQTKAETPVPREDNVEALALQDEE